MAPEYQSPWSCGWRQDVWRNLNQPWDVIVIGGGITGAGILAVAVRSGLSALLIEKGDFASGTSSRSSKLVHGGLRYLKHMQVKLTRESVQERQYLLCAAPGLVEPLGFVYPIYKGDKPSPWLVELGLGVYTHLASDAGKYRRLDQLDISLMAPGLRMKNLERGFHYSDAQTDDARLVLRLLHDALITSKGRAVALNYCRVTSLLKEGDAVRRVQIKDEVSGESAEVNARVVINATGVWADVLRQKIDEIPHLRPLRGSHLFFRHSRFPVYQAIAFSHPDDGRPVFVYPWEGMALAGTTDVDHSLPLDDEPSISFEEADYLMRAVQFAFPELELTKEDIISTQAGVRPVVDTGKKDPSAESREHIVWAEHGLLTVTGGKLTTFRPIAVDALQEAHKLDRRIPSPEPEVELFDTSKPSASYSGINPSFIRRLYGRYGTAVPEIMNTSSDLLISIEGTPYIWAELAWAAKNEAVQHLDDLLLRRFRLGILLPDGGLNLLPWLKGIIQEHLGWDDTRWALEAARYKQIKEVAHGVLAGWRTALKSER
jgi:glycerol-3-phosphate dehydrogenase